MTLFNADGSLVVDKEHMSIEEYKQLFELALKASFDIEDFCPRFGEKEWDDTCALKYAYIKEILMIIDNTCFIVDAATERGLELPTIPELED